MKKFGGRRSMIALVALPLCIGVAFWLLSEDKKGGTVRIAAGTEGGTYYALGTQLAHILKELPEEQIQDVLVLRTSGSEQNIQLLCNPETEDQADLALVMSTTLATASQDQRDEIRALASLYRDVIQVVVRSDSDIRKLSDLRGKKVYIGKDGSGTKQIARAMLKAVKIEDEDYEREGHTKSFAHASRMLKSGELDAAIYCAGTPTDAVREAVEQGSGRLIDLEITPDEISTSEPQFENLLIPGVIPARFYEGQLKPIHTVATQVVLVCKRDLDGGGGLADPGHNIRQCRQAAHRTFAGPRHPVPRRLRARAPCWCEASFRRRKVLGGRDGETAGGHGSDHREVPSHWQEHLDAAQREWCSCEGDTHRRFRRKCEFARRSKAACNRADAVRYSPRHIYGTVQTCLCAGNPDQGQEPQPDSG